MARFIARLNPLPEHYICYSGLTESEITAELSVVLPPEGFGRLALDQAGEVAGFLGVEMDLSLGRAWLFGPFVDASDWLTLADQLYHSALESLPPEIVDLELCGRPENTRLFDFAIRHGFIPGADFKQLSLPRPAVPSASSSAALLVDPDSISPYLSDLANLHDSLFPNTYYSATQLLAMGGDAFKRLQIIPVDGVLAGYIFLQARPASQDAYIDFLGVAEAYRRQGLARKLLSDSLAWAFSYPFVEQAILTVHTDNLAAIRLYESIGFHTDLILRGYRKKGTFS